MVFNAGHQEEVISDGVFTVENLYKCSETPSNEDEFDGAPGALQAGWSNWKIVLMDQLAKLVQSSAAPTADSVTLQLPPELLTG